MKLREENSEKEAQAIKNERAFNENSSNSKFRRILKIRKKKMLN